MMPPHSAAIPPAPRNTLLEWIDNDDGNAPALSYPATSAQVAALHARIVVAPDDGRNELREPIQPPPGLRLAPLG
ncbi:hypothetical protein [Novosphingobium sp. ST904]|nr:hypothetical protein [Novosphingobium sp. ST904]